MNDQQWKDVLRQADALLTPRVPPVPEQADRVRAAEQARRRRSRAVAVTTLASIALVVSFAWRPGRENSPGSPRDLSPSAAIAENAAAPAASPSDELARSPEEIAKLEQRLKACDSEIRIAEQTLAYMRRDAAVDRLARETRRDPREAISVEVDVVAAVMLDRADRQWVAMEPTPAALAAYRNIIELFPNTTAAAAARQYLSN